jgi:hypothetical protein
LQRKELQEGLAREQKAHGHSVVKCADALEARWGERARQAGVARYIVWRELGGGCVSLSKWEGKHPQDGRLRELWTLIA